MSQPLLIAPSVLSADFMNMQRDIDDLKSCGADWIHIDVMDGHFVPNLTMGVPFVAQARKVTDMVLDVHLMIDNPLEQLPWFIETKPDFLTFHYEALAGDNADVICAIEMIHDAGIKAGISIKPDCDTAVLKPFLSGVDMVLVMSVFPGFSGQSYIQGSDDRVAQVATLCRELGVHPHIQVDGGMSPDTAGLVCAAGADVLVAGSGVFKASNRAQAIEDIRAAGIKGMESLHE